MAEIPGICVMFRQIQQERTIVHVIHRNVIHVLPSIGKIWLGGIREQSENSPTSSFYTVHGTDEILLCGCWNMPPGSKV
ncbi:hypothetical protein HPP92_028920 [Vanilla planifolia]|uniref:Uncharacterized protein n=1 Tax=Vanilla planifolia TaxID=51239 RepID=A0A835U2B1_VANPL|nr:hypothetical protein HPP92_028910 [Vanilla planifolia]KAG0446273.1 hypothetical protein HPP92_028920 [Vanilla planifolia]